jgi:hypothetical protein
MSNEIVSKNGYDFKFQPSACYECGGKCCTGESGYIWAKYQEIENMAEFLSLSIDEFASKYLKKVKHRYSLVEKQIGENDYACIFFNTTTKMCEIYDVRPTQCRTFPFWEQFKGNEDEVKKECIGII